MKPPRRSGWKGKGFGLEANGGLLGLIAGVDGLIGRGMLEVLGAEGMGGIGGT